jgi:hypothetical protein
MLNLLKILLIIHLIRAECPFKETTSNQTVIITNFNNLSQLSFNECSKFLIKISDWGLKPNKKIILDNTLHLKGLTLFSNDETNSIHFNNFKGFDLLSNPFKEIKFVNSSFTNIVWYIELSNFEFYINNVLINETQCQNINKSNWNYFIMNSKLVLYINAFYSLKTCPYIFKNTIIRELSIYNVRSSYINSNVLNFQKIKNTNHLLNSNVFLVEFTLYRIRLDTNLLNEDIFKKTGSIQIDGILNGIQDDLFKSFKELKLIRIRTQHVKHLFAKNNKWLESLNFYSKPIDDPNGNIEPFLKLSIFLIIYQSFSSVTFYDYPNEDFCLFSKFPHNKLVFPQLKPNYNSSIGCTCTQLFLIQYSLKISYLFYFYFDQIPKNYEMFQYFYDEINDRKFSNCVKDNGELLNFTLKCNFKQRHMN